MQEFESLNSPSLSEQQQGLGGFFYEASLVAREQEHISAEVQYENAIKHADLLAELEKRK
ncbi:MAG: hypothetical protein IV090_01695 [Candidatus Sericytochromatia bacterium]|jgi:hypothetical protein|nr:hypothetical protein [Candidatus Sericytochromatia bacterium]